MSMPSSIRLTAAATEDLGSLIIAKALGSTALKRRIKSGEDSLPSAGVDDTEFDVTVRARGSFKRGEDTVAVRANTIPWGRIAEVALSKLNGVTLEAVVAEAINGDEAAEATDIKPRVKAIVDGLLEATEAPRKGTMKVVVDHYDVEDAIIG